MDKILSTEISSKKYVAFFEQLAKQDYPKLYERLIRYDEVESLKRLKYIGMFCGMDYVGIEKLNPADFYSRDDHSRVSAFITLLATGNLKQAITARFHDSGTYPFSHIKSYKDGNEAWQDKDEMSVYQVISKDKKVIKLLSEDKIDITKICNASKYPIIDKDRPALCVDRLDGILSSAHIWTKEFYLEPIKELFDLVVVCFQKINGNQLICNLSRKNYVAELCLQDYYNSYFGVTDFMDAINLYTTWQLSKESRYATAFLGDILRFMDEHGVIPQNYFNLSEEEMIEKFLTSPYAFLWQDFTNLHAVRKATDSDLSDYTLNPKTKIRYAYPLIMIQDYFGEIYGLFDERKSLLYPSDDITYEQFIMIEEAIPENIGPLYGEISKESRDVLLRSRK